MSKIALKVTGLQGFYGQSHVLHGINFDVHQGETVGLIGRNGAGKSTTLKAVMGVLEKRSGSVTLNGQELISLPSNRIARKGIAFCPEDRGIFSGLTVTENLLLPPVVAQGGMSLEEIYQLFPNLLERANSGGTKLSGGEQQMLAIARILRTGAKVLLLDEPTEGLAPVIVQQIADSLVELKRRGFTIVLVEQNFKFAERICDRLFVVENGLVIDAIPASDYEAASDRIVDYLGV